MTYTQQRFLRRKRIAKAIRTMALIAFPFAVAVLLCAGAAAGGVAGLLAGLLLGYDTLGSSMFLLIKGGAWIGGALTGCWLAYLLSQIAMPSFRRI